MDIDVESPSPSDLLRSTLATSPDPRAARTKARVLTALAAMEHEGVPLTVSSLVRASGVSRSVFYTHWSGIDELAASILVATFERIGESDISERISGRATSAETARHSLTLLIEHVGAHRQLYRALLAAPMNAATRQTVVDSFVSTTARVLPWTPGAERPTDTTAAATFVSAGMFALLAAWLRGELDLDAAGVVDTLIELIPAWMR